MNILERHRAPEMPSGRSLNPKRDAEHLYDNSPEAGEIYQRVEANQDAIRNGRFGEVSGPSFHSLDAVLRNLDGRGEPDINAIIKNLPKLVTNALAMKAEITKAAQDAREAITSAFASQASAGGSSESEIDALTRQKQKWTPYLQFLPLMPEGKDFSFRGFAEPGKASYEFSESRVAATANGILLNIIFDANHMYREESDVNQLVNYIQQELKKLHGQSP